jgi:hypothetical protein
VAPLVVRNSLFVNRDTRAAVAIASGDHGQTGSTVRLENCRIVQRADAAFMSAVAGGVTPTADARTTRKLIDPEPAYGSITLGIYDRRQRHGVDQPGDDCQTGMLGR